MPGLAASCSGAVEFRTYAGAVFLARSVLEPVSGYPAGAPFARVHWAFTDARGTALDAEPSATSSGAQEAQYGDFNLGVHVGDDPDVVSAHRRCLEEELGVAPLGVVYMNQVHGNDVAVVDGPWPTGVPADVDGLVTTRPGLGLAVLVADCVPVLLADPVAGVIGVAHAGRKGMMAGVAGRTLFAMRELGAVAVTAVIGPSICGRCYEVPEQMRDEAARVRPESAAVTRAGTPGIDVAAGVRAELEEQGVQVQQVSDCTLENENLYSYRRHHRTGRFVGVVVMEPPAHA